MKLCDSLTPYFQLMLAVVTLLCFVQCSNNTSQPVLQDHEIATKWSDLILYITKNTPQNSPTYASRCMGYIGLTMYESVVQGSREYNSIATQLNDLSDLPESDINLDYDWRLSFNAGQAYILKKLYNQTSDINKIKIDSLESAILMNVAAEINDRSIVDRSVQFGSSIAETVNEWSLADGGHRGYLHNFDKEFVHAETPGSWKPPLFAQSFSHHPLHPYWGRNRTFLLSNSTLDIPDIIPFDTSVTSNYYNDFLAVYNKDLSLSQSEKEAALWWGDDPDDTFTPPGHSFFIATILINEYQPDLIRCAETYARVGMSLADAFRNCWKWKYHYFSERPNTFIPQYIDQEWESFWPDPPFPSFPSGHAIQAASAACVLMDMYDNETSFVDSAHVGRERDEVRETDFVERRFERIWDVAVETADSRFYGGIHTSQDNEVGITEGIRIAENVNKLNWKSTNTSK